MVASKSGAEDLQHKKGCPRVALFALPGVPDGGIGGAVRGRLGQFGFEALNLAPEGGVLAFQRCGALVVGGGGVGGVHIGGRAAPAALPKHGKHHGPGGAVGGCIARQGGGAEVKMPGYLGRGCGQVGKEQGKGRQARMGWCAKHTLGAIFTKLYRVKAKNNQE